MNAGEWERVLRLSQKEMRTSWKLSRMPAVSR
jgi:hypothetical protein